MQTKLPLAQFEVFFFCSTTCYLGEEMNTLATNERIDFVTVQPHFALNIFSPSYTPSTKEKSEDTSWAEQSMLPSAGAQGVWLQQLGGIAQRQKENRNSGTQGSILK